MKIYNSYLEIGLRILIILNSLEGKSCNIDKLTYYDHLLLHSGDVIDGPKSILPESPFRYFEYSVKKQGITDSVDFLWRKGLISVDYQDNGIYYKSNRLTELFLDSFESELYKELKETASWVVKNFATYNHEDLRKFFNQELKNKGGDFSNIGIVRT